MLLHFEARRVVTVSQCMVLVGQCQRVCRMPGTHDSRRLGYNALAFASGYSPTEATDGQNSGQEQKNINFCQAATLAAFAFRSTH